MPGILGPILGSDSFGNSYNAYFEADNTGATDVTAELLATITAANGGLVFIPAGTYLVQNLDPVTSVNLFAYPDTVTFKFNLNETCFNTNAQITYAIDSPLQMSVSGLSKGAFVDGYSGTTDTTYVSILTVSSTAGIAPGDLMHICSDNYEAWAPTTSKYGESFVVLGVSATLVYVAGVLEYHDYYTTTPTITKYKTDRTFRISGINFIANGDWRADAMISSGTGGGALNLWCWPRAIVENCKFHDLWAGAIYMRNCPKYIVRDCEFYHLPNYKTAAPDVTLGSNPLATTSGLARITVTQTAHGFATGAFFKLTKATSQVDIGGIPEAQIYDIGFYITVVDANTYYFTTTTAATSTATGGGADVKQSWGNGRLGYGVNSYGASGDGLVQNCTFEQCRHAITTGGYENAVAFSVSSRWYLYGGPTKNVWDNLTSYNAYGNPWDTHEQGSGNLFSNCKTFWSGQSPDYGSYNGQGFQNRGRNTSIINYYQEGGTYGMRFAAIEHRDCVHYVDNAVFKNLTKANTGANAIVCDSQSAFTYKAKIKIGKVSSYNIEDPIYISAGNDVTINELFAEGVTGDGITVAGTGCTLTVHQAKIYGSGASTNGMYFSQAGTFNVWDLFVGGSMARAVYLDATAITATFGRIRAVGCTANGIDMATNCVFNADYIKIQMGSQSGTTYGLTTNTGCTINVDTIIVDGLCDVGIRLDDNAIANFGDVTVKNLVGASTLGMHYQDNSTVTIKNFYGINNANDNLQGQVGSKLFCANAFITNGKSLLDAQSDAIARFDTVTVDLRGSSVAANAQIVLCRDNATTGSNVAIGQLTIRCDDANGLPQYVFAEQTATANKTIFLGDLIVDNWNGVTEPQIYNPAATTFTWNTTMRAHRTPAFTRVVTAAGAVTVVGGDGIVVVNKTVGAATAVTLPTNPIPGKIYTVKDGKGDAAANNITVSPAAGTIDGAATSVINANYGSRNFVYNRTEWNAL